MHHWMGYSVLIGQRIERKIQLWKFNSWLCFHNKWPWRHIRHRTAKHRPPVRLLHQSPHLPQTYRLTIPFATVELPNNGWYTNSELQAFFTVRHHWLPPGDVTPFVRQHRLVRVSDRHLVVDIEFVTQPAAMLYLLLLLCVSPLHIQASLFNENLWLRLEKLQLTAYSNYGHCKLILHINLPDLNIRPSTRNCSESCSGPMLIDKFIQKAEMKLLSTALDLKEIITVGYFKFHHNRKED